MAPQSSVEIGDTPEKGHGKVRRAAISPDKLVTAPSGGECKSMADVLDFAVKSAYRGPDEETGKRSRMGQWEGQRTARPPYVCLHVLMDKILHAWHPLEFTNKPIMGERELIKIHKEEKEITKTVEGKEVKDKKTWQYYELSDYKVCMAMKWLTDSQKGPNNTVPLLLLRLLRCST